METFGAAVDGGDDDFLDQQPDQADGDFMSDDDDFLDQEPGQGEEEYYSMSDDEDDAYGSDDDFWSGDDDWSTQGDNDDGAMSDDDEEEHTEAAEYPFPMNAPPAAASEAAIAALEAAEAPADDCCPVCLQDGCGEAPEPKPAAARPWIRVAPCGHRFHAACVDRWLKVKLTCPVCRCPAAVRPAPAAAARPTIPAIVDEFLAVSFEESYWFDKTPRWNEFVDNRDRHVTWNPSWEVS